MGPRPYHYNSQLNIKLIFINIFVSYADFYIFTIVLGSIPGTSTNFKCRLGLERGPPSLVRAFGLFID